MSDALDRIIRQKAEEADRRKAAEAAGHPDYNVDPEGFLRKAIEDCMKRKVSGTVGDKLTFPPEGKIDAMFGYLPYMNKQTLAAIQAMCYPKPKPPPAMKPAQNSGVGAAPSADSLKDLHNAASAGVKDPFAEMLKAAASAIKGTPGAPVDPNSIK